MTCRNMGNNTCSAIEVDADTVRIGGSAFKREYEANKKHDGFIRVCSRCRRMLSCEIVKEASYCPHCGAKFVRHKVLPVGCSCDKENENE